MIAPRRARPRSPSSGRRIVGHSSIYIAGWMLQRGISVLLLPVVTRVLSVDEFGLAGIAVAAAGLLAILCGLGLADTVGRFYFEHRDAPRQGWSSLVIAQAAGGLGLAAAAWITGPLWSQLFSEAGWGPALQISVLYGYVMALQTTALGLLRVARRPLFFVVATVLATAGGGGLGVALATRYGAAGYLGGLCVGSVVATVVAIAATFRPPAWSRALLRGAVALSLPFMLHGFSTWGLELADRVLIGILDGLDAVARYQVAYALASLLVFAMSAVQAAWVPFYLGDLDPEQQRRMPSELIVPAAMIGLMAATLLVLAAPLAYLTVLPSTFAGAGTEGVIALVAASAVFRAAYFVAIVIPIQVKDSRSVAIASTAGALLNVGLILALVPTVGLVGGGIATFVAFSLQALIVLRDAERKIDRTLHIGTVMALGLAAAAALVGIALLPVTLPGQLARAAIGGAAVIGVILSAKELRRSFERVAPAIGAREQVHAPP